MNKVKVSNLDDLKNILDRINSGHEVHVFDLDFSKLSQVKIKIFGKNYNGKLDSNIIHAMSNYHNELLKVYCMVKYRETSLKKLSLDDRKLLIIEYQVNSGCTEIISSLKELFESVGETFGKMTSGMTSNQKTSCYILTVLAIAGYFTFSEASNYNLKQQRQVLNAQVKMIIIKLKF